MGWSNQAPTLPSGSSWSSESSTGWRSGHVTGWRYKGRFSVARGAGQTVYVRAYVDAECTNNDQVWNNEAKFGPEVKVGSGSWVSKSRDSARGNYGETTFGPYYYEGTASNSVTIYARAYYDSDHVSVNVTGSNLPYLTYTVSYNGNGSDGGSTADQTKVSGTDLTLSACGFTKTRYRFVEWNTKADGTGTSYQPGDTYSTNAALTLYAIWEKATIPVYVNPSGSAVYEADAAYVNIGGQIKEADVYINIGGHIYLIS